MVEMNENLREILSRCIELCKLDNEPLFNIKT
jgi:hypothetical protein